VGGGPRVALLGIDTSGTAAYVTSRVGDLSVTRCSAEAAGIAESLPSLTAEVFRAVGSLKRVSFAEISIVLGPGGYTGLRTGLAYAEGLSLADSAPLYGASVMTLGILGSLIDDGYLSDLVADKGLSKRLRGRTYLVSVPSTRLAQGSPSLMDERFFQVLSFEILAGALRLTARSEILFAPSSEVHPRSEVILAGQSGGNFGPPIALALEPYFSRLSELSCIACELKRIFPAQVPFRPLYGKAVNAKTMEERGKHTVSPG